MKGDSIMFCPNCGGEVGSGKFCQYCGSELNTEPKITNNAQNTAQNTAYNYQPPQPEDNKKPVYKKWWFWVLIVLAILIIIPKGSNDKNADEPSITTVSDNEKETITQSKYTQTETTEKTTTTKATTTTTQVSTTDISEFKKSCVKLDYKAIERDPDLYKGKAVKFTGKVIQVSETDKWFSDDTLLTLRIDTKEDEYGFWDDTVYVEYTLPAGSSRILEDDIVTVYGTCTGVTTYTAILGNSITIPSVDAVEINLKK